jgi:hypothetical protein
VTPTIERRGPSFWIGVAIGWALILIGVRGLIVDHDLTNPKNLFGWLIALAVLHDAFVAPVAYAAAIIAGRLLPPRAVVPVRVGLASTALLVVFAWPLVRGYGRRESNPTALPLDYGRNLVASLVVVWTAVAVWIVADVLRDHHHATPTAPPGDE